MCNFIKYILFWFLLGTLVSLTASTAQAVPANPTPFTLTQPDGTPFQAQQIGDERISYFATLGGQVIEKDYDGYWVYKGTNYRVGINYQPTDAPPAGSEPRTMVKQIPQDSQLNQYLNTIVIPSIPPEHKLYWLKLKWEELQEKFTLDGTKLIKLKQKHLQNRIDELKYDITFKNSRNAEKLLQKIQTKRIELDSDLEEAGGDITGLHESIKRQNTEVLANLLNDPRMPESSRKGLQNALNKSGMMKQIKANMVQGTYRANPSALKMMPFSAAWLFEPSEQKWYSIIVYSNKIEITDTMVSMREYDLYPTQAQIEEIKQLVAKINKQGKITIKDKITLTKLWFTIQKQEVN